MQSLCEAKRNFMSMWVDGLSPDYRFNFVCWVDEKISQFKRYGKINFGDCEGCQYPTWVSQILYSSVREKFDNLLADTSTRGKQAIKKSLICLDILNRQMEDDRTPKIRKESRTPRKSYPRKTDSIVSENKQKVDDNKTPSKLSQVDLSDEKTAKNKHKSASGLISEVSEMNLTYSPAKYIKLDDFSTPVSSPMKITKRTPVKNIITALQESGNSCITEKSDDFESIFGQFVNVTSKISKTPTKNAKTSKTDNSDRDLRVSEQENTSMSEKQVIEFTDFCGEDYFNEYSNFCAVDDSNMVSDVILSDVEKVTLESPTKSTKIIKNNDFDKDLDVSNIHEDTDRSEKQVIKFTDFCGDDCFNKDSSFCTVDEGFNMVSDVILSDVEKVDLPSVNVMGEKISEFIMSEESLQVNEILNTDEFNANLIMDDLVL